MKITILSDIHGNLVALDKVFKKEKDSDLYFVIGDTVNYGPWSEECVQYLNSINNIFNIIGNHEVYFIKKNCSAKNLLVKEFFYHSIKDFNSFKLINEYKRFKNYKNYRFIHTIKNKYIYENTNLNFNIKCNYFIGHTHCQYHIKRNNYSIINPGSVGQNRNKINEINYINMIDDKISFKKMTYNLNHVVSEMKKKHYPIRCIEYYKNKI